MIVTAPLAWSVTGRFRLSFNRAGAAPLVWSVALLDDLDGPVWDLAVRNLGITGCQVVTVYAPKPTPDDEDGHPSAYLVTRGRLTVDETGVALIEAGE